VCRKAPTLLLAIAGLLVPLHAAIKVEPWVPAFQGVEIASGVADQAEPRLQKAFAVRVDLRAPGIELFSTPSAGLATKETLSETTSEFLTHHHLQVAINANFFNPCCTPGEKNLIGLAMSGGKVVSPTKSRGIGAAVMVATRGNQAWITTSGKGFQTDPYWTAVAGSGIILRDGVIPPLAGSEFNLNAHPRTALGLSKGGRYLIMLVIDGRQPGYSEGATMDELASWLLRFGAADALNLDGGGSTTLVRADGGKAVVVNKPSGIALGSIGTLSWADEPELRSNGNNLGVVARPLKRKAQKNPRRDEGLHEPVDLDLHGRRDRDTPSRIP
jgi:hypothetical protein